MTPSSLHQNQDQLLVLEPVYQICQACLHLHNMPPRPSWVQTIPLGSRANLLMMIPQGCLSAKKEMPLALSGNGWDEYRPVPYIAF